MNLYSGVEVPPLEDLSDVIEQIQSMQCINKGTNDKPPSPELTEVPQKQTTKNSKPQTFGGFQKGFLNKKPKNMYPKRESNNPIPTKEEQIPTIYPKQEESNSLRLPEVQKAMDTSFLQNKGLSQFFAPCDFL